jgi:hypothetical protein
MIEKMKTAILKVFLGVLVLYVFQMNAFSRFMLNGTSKGFEETEQTIIEGYVIEGAGYFLKSQSETLLLLNKIELSDLNGVDFTELQKLVKSALMDMANAKSEYILLIQAVNTAPYKQTVIDQLKSFEYYAFQQVKDLDSVIFEKMETYLVSGDIRGIYQKILMDTQTIIDKLTTVKSNIDMGTLPSNSDLWRLNQSYFDTLFLGQYAAEIFYEISGKN